MYSHSHTGYDFDILAFTTETITVAVSGNWVRSREPTCRGLRKPSVLQEAYHAVVNKGIDPGLDGYAYQLYIKAMGQGFGGCGCMWSKTRDRMRRRWLMEIGAQVA
ncbi:hypothetical protein B0T13DRAFT_255462 [Neurospora crassa]|nr:hypothetical protein B0T13DRAFT_255462 [Neurospora crassa]